jgi:hypothetical protein
MVDRRGDASARTEAAADGPRDYLRRDQLELDALNKYRQSQHQRRDVDLGVDVGTRTIQSWNALSRGRLFTISWF